PTRNAISPAKPAASPASSIHDAPSRPRATD
ncbi:hypothetical protein A2U01_0061481, partial [Trifolium medium]|nr:hypothetical protein [Trifolium medium]